MSNLANPPMSVDEFAIDAPFFIMFSDVQSPSWYLHSMDWFKGHFTGKPHDLRGKIPLVSGSQISPSNQSMESMDEKSKNRWQVMKNAKALGESLQSCNLPAFVKKSRATVGYPLVMTNFNSYVKLPEGTTYVAKTQKRNHGVF